jgi:hypothetical protein
VDELLIELHRDYEITGKRNYLLENFIVFESTDRLEAYHVFLDSNGIVNEYIGLSIVHYSFDEISRPALIEGFNSKGERYYWDFPPITMFRYFEDTVILYLTKIRQMLSHEPLLDTTYNVFVKTEKYTDEFSKYDKTNYLIYTKDSTCILRFSVCSNGAICKSKNGVYFNYRELDSIDKSTISHERFYDTLFQLVEAPHLASVRDENLSGYEYLPFYAYSLRILHDVDDCGLYEMWFFNAQGEQVWFIRTRLRCRIEPASPGLSGGPINNPSSKWQSFWGRFRLRRC